MAAAGGLESRTAFLRRMLTNQRASRLGEDPYIDRRSISPGGFSLPKQGLGRGLKNSEKAQFSTNQMINSDWEKFHLHRNVHYFRSKRTLVRPTAAPCERKNATSSSEM